eukprot:CAMPEP_0185027064 /NCGR_PEP_ID=MMETSP1103-20130426/11880_1 /TAXON_ID=36769 /ORGANISM="Paraphysomonas bandaiensis, Strain Caron Lab Isolate" /LENGTH=404 /DNA_ID=CAMNT_0027560907 /DNA_START=145 /DNA_END=1359 /DNA_ORIENTATION=-
MRSIYLQTTDSEEMSDLDVHDKMAKAYDELVREKYTHSAEKAHSKPKQESKSTTIKRKTPSRRRSFENPNIPSKSGATKAAAKKLPPRVPSKSTSLPDTADENEVEGDISKEAEVTVPPNVDSWDSVTEQPSCIICKMVFSTATKLDTHLKYSEVHKKNVMAIDAEKEAKEKQSEPKPDILPAISNNRCREIYSGSKFFWRTKKTLEINLFVHFEQKCIEVCAYDNSTGEEYPRIYLKEETVYNYIGGDTAIQHRVQTRSDSRINGGLSVPPVDVLHDEERRLAISSHIMTCLQLPDDILTPDGDVGKNSIKYIFSPTTVAQDAGSPLLSTKPADLTPVLIPRRRLSSSEEIENVLQNIASMEQDLQKRTANAEAVAQSMLSKNEELLKHSASTGGIAMTTNPL